ncbi:regulator of Ty1 Transposition [Kalmusia sp. IMI 367209]|nr:regulator of Ty1 Transposition [Kalmusia sp. IMI 367209]
MEDTTMLEASQPLFEGLTFTIVPMTLTQNRVMEISDNIKACGGDVKPFDISVGRIQQLEELNYIVSATTDFPDYYRALDVMIHVVKPLWIDGCLTVNKIKNPRAYSPDPALFMHDVVVCCGEGLPEGDKEAIYGGVLAMGGQYGIQLSKLTTHLIALNMEDPRCQVALKKKLPLKIVLPHWFNDCLKVGSRVNERPYLLPNPEIMNTEAGAIPPTVTSADIRDATDPEPASAPSSPPPAHLAKPRAIKAFDGKKVMLSHDLKLNDRLKDVITGLIEAGGGTITTIAKKADIYVCNYRKGDDYVTTSQLGKDVGNLSWLYYLITHDTWTNPMRRMMHYPRPPDGIGNFKNYKISISSYTGEARVYLENLIKSLGAEFTRTFKQDNTHLITAHRNSEKCEAAEEWGVHIVNHLWLEDSYADCKEKPITLERYTYFPPRMNMGEILGSTEINRDSVRKMYFSKRKVLKEPDAMPNPAAGVGRSHTENEAHNDSLVEKPSRRTKSGGDVTTPARGRQVEGKENKTPGSRGAKDRALSNLHNVMDDVNQYEKESKRKGGVIHGGRRRKEDEIGDKEREKKKDRESMASKRSIDEIEADDATSDEEAEEIGQKNKKARKGRLTPIKHRMIVSGDKRWHGQADKMSKDMASLRELGLYIMDDCKKADLLCAPKVMRTLKFVATLASGPKLVSSEYLDYALKHNKLPLPEKFPLQDKETEKQYALNLTDTVARAKQNKHRLLKDWTIFCTKETEPKNNFDTYKEIIIANGGNCLLWNGRNTTVTASKRKIESQPKEVSQNLEEDDGDILYLISAPLKSQFELWVKFRELAAKHDMIPRIVSPEWLLHVAMAQKMHWKPEWELKEEDAKDDTKGKK